MNGVERHWANAIASLSEAIAERRKLVLNPHVDMNTNNEIYDHIMRFTETGQRFLDRIRDDIKSLRAHRHEHHAQLDSNNQTSDVASSTNQKNDQTTGSP